MSCKQLKLTDMILQQLRHSSSIVDSRLGLIQARCREWSAQCLVSVLTSDFSASHELLTERVAVLEARVDAADSDSTGVRGKDSALRSQVSELRSRPSSIEASRVSPDNSISGIPASVADSPRTMVLKVFEVLGIPEMGVDALGCSLSDQEG